MPLVVIINALELKNEWILKCDTRFRNGEPCEGFVMLIPQDMAVIAANELGVSENRLVRALAAGHGWKLGETGDWTCSACLDTAVA